REPGIFHGPLAGLDGETHRADALQLAEARRADADDGALAAQLAHRETTDDQTRRQQTTDKVRQWKTEMGKTSSVVRCLCVCCLFYFRLLSIISPSTAARAFPGTRGSLPWRLRWRTLRRRRPSLARALR